MELAVLLGRVEGLIEARELLNQGLAPLLEVLKDTSLPLADRWEAYTKLVKNNILVKNESYGDGYIDLIDSNGSLYDDFNVERYNTESYTDMYDRIMDTTEEYDREYNPSLLDAKTNGNLEKWQEQVLSRGYSSFTHDW